jgi:Ca2+-binding RTX toxin-like protein
LQTQCGGPPVFCGDAFVSLLSADGSDLEYSTYLGGDYQDQGDSIALDSAGQVYVTGYTDSATFPITDGAAQETFGGFDDVFLSKFDLGGRPLCTVRGTAGSDVLTGTAGADVICGLGGEDVLVGRGGDDLLLGGSGKDTIKAGSGADRLEGGSGNDRLEAVDHVKGNDHLYGGPGRDRCKADQGDERVGCAT